MPYCHVDPPEEGWGEWDDEVKDKKVAYMVSQIDKGHIFTKEEWPGGLNNLPLIKHVEKKPALVHRKHIVPGRKTVSAALRLNKSPSKLRQPKRVTEQNVPNDGSNDVTELKVWVESQLLSLKEDHALKLKKLEARITSLVKKLKRLRWRRTQIFHTRKSAFIIKKSATRSKPLPTVKPAQDSPKTSGEDVSTPPEIPNPLTSRQDDVLRSPGDILLGDHDWSQYSQVCGIILPFILATPISSLLMFLYFSPL